MEWCEGGVEEGKRSPLAHPVSARISSHSAVARRFMFVAEGMESRRATLRLASWCAENEPVVTAAGELEAASAAGSKSRRTLRARGGGVRAEVRGVLVGTQGGHALGKRWLKSARVGGGGRRRARGAGARGGLVFRARCVRVRGEAARGGCVLAWLLLLASLAPFVGALGDDEEIGRPGGARGGGGEGDGHGVDGAERGGLR